MLGSVRLCLEHNATHTSSTLGGAEGISDMIVDRNQKSNSASDDEVHVDQLKSREEGRARCSAFLVEAMHMI